MSVPKRAGKALTTNGQDSIFKLLYAPFTFLSTGNERALLDMLTAAIGFLEGYSTETLETDAVFERNNEGTVIARSQLKLVPYASIKPTATPHPLSAASQAPLLTSSPKERRLPSSHQQHHLYPNSNLTESALTIEQRFTQSPRSSGEEVSTELLEALLRCFSVDATLGANKSFETLLQEPACPVFTKLAVACYSQTGLTVPSSSFKTMLSSLATYDEDLAQRVALDYEFEMDLTSFVSQLPHKRNRSSAAEGTDEKTLKRAEKTTSRGSKQSRLERIRSKKAS